MTVFMLHLLLALEIGFLGVSKGYTGWLCGVIGFFGGVLALPIMAMLPDKNAEQEQAELRRRYDAQLDALHHRVGQLEAALSAGGEAAAAEPATEPAKAGPLPEGAPGRFAARTRDVIACPRCGKRQMGNRDRCYSCGLPFVYDRDGDVGDRDCTPE